MYGSPRDPKRPCCLNFSDGHGLDCWAELLPRRITAICYTDERIGELPKDIP